MTTLSFINEDAGRKATLSDKGLMLSKISGVVRKTERLMWPLFEGDEAELLDKAERWVMKGQM